MHEEMYAVPGEIVASNDCEEVSFVFYIFVSISMLSNFRRLIINSLRLWKLDKGEANARI